MVGLLGDYQTPEVLNQFVGRLSSFVAWAIHPCRHTVYWCITDALVIKFVTTNDKLGDEGVVYLYKYKVVCDRWVQWIYSPTLTRGKYIAICQQFNIRFHSGREKGRRVA